MKIVWPLFLILSGVSLAGWISCNLLIDMQSDIKGSNPLPVFFLAVGAVVLGFLRLKELYRLSCDRSDPIEVNQSIATEELMAKVLDAGGIQRVFVDEGCLVCSACEMTCPEVFEVTDCDCFIRPDASRYYESHVKQISDASLGCCVEVIKIECRDGSVFSGNI